MPIFSKKDWTGYFVELIVVVVGILIAFQVDEWREGLAKKRELQAALVRLKEETQTNIGNCERFLPLTVRLAESVQLVLQSIESGKLEDTEIGKFEYGLTHIGFQPARNYLTTVAEEMIATGLLKEIDDADLQTNIAIARAQSDAIQRNSANQSRFLQSVIDELARSVDYRYMRPFDPNLAHHFGPIGSFEDDIEVRYDFGSLAANSYLKNLLIETTDGYFDLYRMNYAICHTVREIDQQLVEQGVN